MSNKIEKNETEKNTLDSLNTSFGTKSYQTISPENINMMFENILPPHTEEEKHLLESIIKKDGGILSPLTIWKDGNKNILIDGHLRHQIALKLKLECPVIFKEFSSKDDATKDILDNQFGRRNLSIFSRCELYLKFEHIYKVEGKRNQSKGGKGLPISDEDRIDTKRILSEKADVSSDTLSRVKNILSDNPDPETITKLRRGEISVNKVYTSMTGKTGKKSKNEFELTSLFDGSGNLIPDFTTIKTLTITPSKDGQFRIEVTLKDKQKQYFETTNLIKVTEEKPFPNPSNDEPLPTEGNPVPEVPVNNPSGNLLNETGKDSTLTQPDNNRLHILYEEYDFSTITNPLWEDLRIIYINDVRRMLKTSLPDSGKGNDYNGVDDRHPSSPCLNDVRTMFIQSVRATNGKRKKYHSLNMDEHCKFPKLCEKIRLELLGNWKKKNQPLGGSRKSHQQIIESLKEFKDADSKSILMSDDFGEENLLSTDRFLTSGISQYFPEMMDTPTYSGKSPMDVIKNSETFMKFMERVIVADGMHLFSKSIEYKNNLKNAA
jgi:hypothetical protein